ncbi:tetratricopeptide repeat protein [candidate division FCPU426 bacterium]|nr:tetratricopeptide repeat protein [candidate division FCPU426 bacterium]
MKTQTHPLDGNSILVRICDWTNAFLLYLVMFSIPLFFIILTRDQFELPKLTLLRILTVLMLGVWGIRILAAGRFDFRRTPLDVPIAVWCILQILTTFISVSPYVSYRGEYENFRGLLTVLNYPVLYYIAVHFIRSRIQIQRLFFVILLTGLITTVYGIAQFFGLDFIAWNPTSIAPGRYFSSLGNPNFLASYLAMVMPIIVIFFIETASRFRRIILFVCFIVMYTALLGTWSRGGFLGLLAALGVLAVFGLLRAYRAIKCKAEAQQLGVSAMAGRFLRQHKSWAYLIGIMMAILISISATYGKNHMFRMADTIVHLKSAVGVSRFHIWGPALGMIRDYPLLGTGLDTFKTVFPRYATPDFAVIDGANVSSRTAHNEILQVLSTQGIIGMIIVVWLTVVILRTWWAAYRSSQDRWQDRLFLVGLLAGWTAYSVQNLFSFGVVSIDTFYWLILALIVLLQNPPDKQIQLAPAQAPETKPKGLLGALAPFRPLLMLALAALAFFISWRTFQSALADYAYNLGTIYRLQSMWDHSLFAFSKAASLTPTEVKYVVYRGLAYEEKSKQAAENQRLPLILEAIKAYRRGVEMNPTNAYYLGNLGRAYALAFAFDPQNQEYYKESVFYYQEAIRFAPVTVLFYQNLAMTHLSNQKEKEFGDVIQKLAAFDPVEAARLEFAAGNTYYNINALEKAREWYQSALRHHPQYVEAYFNLGVTCARLADIPQAVLQWQKALELNPRFTPAQQMLERYHSDPRSQIGHVIMNAP